MTCYQNYIKNILIVGLGGVGTVYANKIKSVGKFDLRILVDESRYNKYKQSPRILNGEKCFFNYILPLDNFSADLVIITTKSNGLDKAINDIKNFLKKDTIIISLINGISSESKIIRYYPDTFVIPAYVICHSINRIGNEITHDGITKIVWGYNDNDMIIIHQLKQFFKDSMIENEYSCNIQKSLWEKFCFNCCVNQLSVLYGFTFEQMWNDKICLVKMEKIAKEIDFLAKRVGLSDVDLVASTFSNLYKMIPNGKTSMLQDYENYRIPELDLFGGEVLKLADKYNIDLPENKALYIDVKRKFSVYN